jgi:hypothetical protein
VRVDVTGPGGQRATDTLRVVTGGRLPLRLPRIALRRYLCQFASCTETTVHARLAVAPAGVQARASERLADALVAERIVAPADHLHRA